MLLMDQVPEIKWIGLDWKYLDNYPTAVFWSNFLDMVDILHRFVYYQPVGNWMDHLCESARMLPYLTAAGHFKYGQQSLPLYL